MAELSLLVFDMQRRMLGRVCIAALGLSLLSCQDSSVSGAGKDQAAGNAAGEGGCLSRRLGFANLTLLQTVQGCTFWKTQPVPIEEHFRADGSWIYRLEGDRTNIVVSGTWRISNQLVCVTAHDGFMHDFFAFNVEKCRRLAPTFLGYRWRFQGGSYNEAAMFYRS